MQHQRTHVAIIGARIVGHLALVLAEAPGGTLAAAGLCGGGGQGSAMVLQAL